MTLKSKPLVLLIFSVALLVGCQSSPPPTPKEMTVEGAEFKFTPESLEVNVGQPVKLTFKNLGVLEHDFSVMEIPLLGNAATEPASGHSHEMTVQPELHVAASGGQAATITFTPTEPGTYEILCTVAGHKEAGMKGLLVVKAP